MATANPCSGSRRNPSLPASGACWWQPLKCLDHTLPAPCPASSRRKVQFLLIRYREWPKYFVNFLAPKGNEATSVSVHWHRSKLNNWEICFRGEIQSTYFLDFTLPLEAELCLFLPLFQAGWTLLHKKWEGWGRASRLFCILVSGSSCQTKSYIGKHFLFYTKTINCLMCKVKPESYSHKFTLKSTFLLALSKRNLHTGSTVRFFGLSSKKLFLSFLSDLLPASPRMKSKPKICWEMGRATADLCKSNFFKARANRRVPTLCIAETYDAIQGMNSPWCNLILNPVFLLCVRGWRRQSVVQVTESSHN